MRSLTTKQRDELLRISRKDTDPELRSRAHIILLLAEGHPRDTIEAMLFCSSRTLDRGKKRFEDQGIEGLTGRKRGRPFRFSLAWVAVLVSWVTTKTPPDFGFLRSRWSCAILALRLRPQQDVKVIRETVQERVYAELRKLLEGLPETRRRSGRTRSRSTPTPRSGRWGCSRVSKRRSRRRGRTRSGICRGRSPGGPARCS